MAKAKKEGKSQTAAESSPFLRRENPVRVRRGFRDWRFLPLKRMLVTTALLGTALSTAYGVNHYLHSDERFSFSIDEGLQVTGLNSLHEDAIRKVFQADDGGRLIEIDLEERRQMLVGMNWIRNASLARIWPNQIWVYVEERQPVAFARLPESEAAAGQALIDSDGVFLERPKGTPFALPVVTGVIESMPIEERKKRMDLYLKLVNALDSEEPRYLHLVSEVGLADPENAIVTTLHGSDVLKLQMGDEHLRHRFEIFLKYIDSWKVEYGAVRSVDLRFKGLVTIQ